MKYKYTKVKLPNGKTVDRHRLIMEEYLGRLLEPEEEVHHCNENKKDDTLENLELVLKVVHRQEHFRTGIFLPCGFCSTEVYCSPGRMRQSKLKIFFCDRHCRNNYQGAKGW
ncbi:hypothetical protein LCGC14_1529300 [marine sediment metagenome]|uniref:HNH nuclease domain-containing protein n=1 Tax=marine sediment metagenome TaxID=412755 RepID=A0A0F9LBY8_9ZZZZ